MGFRRHLELEHGQKEINITPLVDMVFLLLVFFMLTSSFVILPGIKINLPRAVTSEVIQEKNIVITIGKNQALYFNEKLISQVQLIRNLQEGKSSAHERPILIKADTDVPLGRVVTVWDICRKAGISQINIATLKDGRQ